MKLRAREIHFQVTEFAPLHRQGLRPLAGWALHRLILLARAPPIQVHLSEIYLRLGQGSSPGDFKEEGETLKVLFPL